MSKSVYSLVLSDDIVRAVDALAYKMNTSRSGLIDRILAERLSVQTPETVMRSITDAIGRFFDEDIFRLQPASDGALLIKSPLSYKYKPTIRYAVDILPQEDTLGRLRVSFRTQNAVLSMLTERFWRIFAAAEAKYLPENINVKYTLEDGRFTRTLHSPVTHDGRKINAEDAARAIADYVGFIDRQIKTFFDNAEDEVHAAALIDADYRNRIRTADILV